MLLTDRPSVRNATGSTPELLVSAPSWDARFGTLAPEKAESALLCSQATFTTSTQGVTGVSFERGFADVERAASGANKAAQGLVALIKALEKAAREGDLAAIDRTTERLDAALTAVRQEVSNARSAWPMTSDEVERHLAETYGAELLDAARTVGLAMSERDGRYVAFPSIVRILPGERAVRIDRKRVTGIRPSRVAAHLKAEQGKKPKFPVERFIEALFKAYMMIVQGDVGRTVLLDDILAAFTLRPGSASDYDQSDFTRDVYALDRSGIRTTRSGARVSLPAATGTKGQKGVLTFVGPDGELVTYYGIRFEEPS